MSYIKKSKRNGKIYLSEVETSRVNGKVVTKHLRYVGKEADGKTILSSSISNLEVEQVKVFGPLMVLNHIAKELDLSTLLGRYGDEILSMVFAHCLDYESVNKMPDWFSRTDLSMMLNLNGVTEDRLLKALDSLERQDSTQLQKSLFEKVSEKYNINKKGVIYDVTNTYLYGSKCPLGKMGKDKDGVKGRPLIQIGLGLTQDEGVPVFHKTFPGNIHDSRTLQDLITTFHEFGIKDGLMVFDKGINSNKNQRDLKGIKWGVLCGLPIDKVLKPKLRELIAKNKFLDFKNRVKLKNATFYVQTIKHSVAGIEGTLAFCFNEKQKRDLKESRYDEICNAQLLIAQKKEIKQDLRQFFGSSGEVLYGKISEREEFDGYSAIFSTKKLTKENIVKTYFDKDLVEKAFRSLKGVVNLRPIRHWLYNRVTAHVFICYLSFLILTLLKIKIAKLNMTPTHALNELDSLYKVYIKDKKKGFRLHRVVAMNKKQEAILRAIDKKLLKNM